MMNFLIDIDAISKGLPILYFNGILKATANATLTICYIFENVWTGCIKNWA